MALAHVISERGTEGDEERQKKVAQLIKNIRSDEAEKEQAKAEQSKPISDAVKKPEEKKDDTKASHLDPEIVKSINETILDSSPNVKWEDVKGLVEVKKVL